MLKVLQFHKISPRLELGGTTNTPRQFENFIKLILNNNYSPTLPGLMNHDKISKPIIITFDDGYRSIYEYAFPIIKRYQVKVLVFLITGYIGRKNMWDLGLWGTKNDHLGWHEIIEMKDYGIEFGSHTVSHVDLTRLTQTRLDYELNYSKEVIEKHIGKIESISFPFNRLNAKILAAARNAGYQYGFGGFANNSFPMAIFKDAVYITDNMRSLKVKITEHPSLLYKYEKLKSRIINLFSMTTVLLRHYD